MENLIRINEYPVKPVLKLLLTDKSTKQNIVFATNSYSHLVDTPTTKVVGFLLLRPLRSRRTGPVLHGLRKR